MMSSDASSNQPRASLIAVLLRDPLERRAEPEGPAVPEGLADDGPQPRRRETFMMESLLPMTN